jgi:transcription-repair coupling factor (superfamily II helicase)
MPRASVASRCNDLERAVFAPCTAIPIRAGEALMSTTKEAEPLISESLTPGARPERGDARVAVQAPAAAVAAALAANATRSVSVHIASSERRAEEIGRALAGLAAGVEVLVLPPWDCLPYDRASPSRDVMGRRMRTLRALAGKAAEPRILVTSPEALAQKFPPQAILDTAFMTLRCGERLDLADLARFAARTGYVVDDRIDEPGEIAFLGEVTDIFPADAARPVRILLGEDGLVEELRLYDPLTQRTEGQVEMLVLGPASEWIDDEPDQGEGAGASRTQGLEHALVDRYGALDSLFDLLPKARVTQDDKTPARLAEVELHIAEAFEARQSLGGIDGQTPPHPAGLYLLGEDLAAGLAAWTARRLDLDDIAPTPNLAIERNPGRAFCDLVDEQRRSHRRVVLTGLKHELRPLAKALARGLDLKPEPVTDWTAALATNLGEVVALPLDLDTGFIDAAAGLAVIAASDVLGGRLAAKNTPGVTDLLAEPDLRIGDVVLHEDHGVGVLRDLKTVEIDGLERDTLQLDYHGGASLLAPVEEIGRIWRYGAEAAAVTLDRLTGDGWQKRRAEVSRQVDEAALELVALAKAREVRTCEPILPPKTAYAKFAARFAYPETPDQSTAIEAVLADLASGRPMDRLVCGDVGFGKTEVALRAAAAVALGGRQVAIAAPTTVLARQHFETFRRRFAGTGIGVAHLSRLVSPAEARAVKQGLESGEIGVVIGTQALAGKDLAFDNLGLMIIDEEQKFGAALKAQLRDLAEGGHLLTLTATPIPRTLQAAMVGIQDVSLIASPPARRRPIRTFLAPFDPASLRTALLREKRRGGQSFFVVPRIEDIGPLTERLAQLAPELSVRVAHGGLSAEEADAVMVGFADGQGDVLLATNIIESGLDVPRANTMFVWRPDRFGLSQLHQLRGRVGRGRVQGVAYLLADPDDDMPDATRARLSTLEAFDRLGSGLAISARDLDLRGGGDLVGEDQAGHVKMIGAALYQRLLERAVRVARGEMPAAEWTPVLNLGETGAIPLDYVPDAVTRINLYARLARLANLADIDAFEEELEDRFGAVPPAAISLLALARLQILARAADVRQVNAGPRGLAFTLEPTGAATALKRVARVAPEARIEGHRLLIATPTDDGGERRLLVERLLLALSA